MGNKTNEKGFQRRVVQAANYLILTHRDTHTHAHNPTDGPSASHVSVHRQTGFFFFCRTEPIKEPRQCFSTSTLG